MHRSLLFLFAIALGASQTLAQDKVTGTRSLDSFHSIIVSSEIDAELVLSRDLSLEYELSGAESNQLITELEDGILNIRMKTGLYKDARLKVMIYFWDLNSIEATGRASVWSQEDLYTDTLEIKLFNGGATRLTLFCDTLSVNLSQGSILTLRGKARSANIKVNTNATFNGYEMACEEMIVNATSTGKAKVSVSKLLNATASTGGFVGYVGDPEKVERKTSLRGEIVETFLE